MSKFLRLYQLSGLKMASLAGFSGLLSQSSCLRDQTANCVGYSLGDTGFVSLAELRSVLAPFSQMSVTTEKNVPFPISHTDPRTFFLLASADRLSPAIQVGGSYFVCSGVSK